jgi:aryl-alcohol dehydrogenase-like predicted oxidoreductase
MTAPACATAAGTAARAAEAGEERFYRPGWDGLRLASIGLGSYLGQPDGETDAGYAAAARRYLQLGGNLIDTAINYRFQRSERAIGAALREAFAAGFAGREAVVVCTKGGYLSFDSDWPADPDQWAYETFVATGVVEPEEIVDGHCMAPAYLRHQIAQSLRNLQLECLDLYYLHNPEGQRAAVGKVEFKRRLREAFATLEVAVAQGQIGAYGTATWNGYRAQPEAPDYLSLSEVLDVARDVAGDRHHFRAIQLPLNFQMLEALARPNQPGADGLRPLLAAAAEHSVTVIASASLLQGAVLGRLPASLRAHFTPGLSDAQRALQFVRSTPGVTSALAGMSRPAHVEENLGLRAIPPMTREAYQAIFADQRKTV